jgi:Condensin complex subunit 2
VISFSGAVLLSFSAQIYSYRVDDVHLTSYKVLANLSRNDADGTKGKQAGDRHDDDDGHGGDLGGAEDGDGDGDQNRTRSRRKPDFKASGPTLESNVCTSYSPRFCLRLNQKQRSSLSR